MKLNKVKKRILIGVAVGIFVLMLPIFALYNDTCRGYIVNYVISRLQTENLSVKVDGLNKDLTYIDKITVKYWGNLVELYKIHLKRLGVLSFEQISIDKAVVQTNVESVEVKDFKKTGTTKPVVAVETKETEFELKDGISYVQQFRSYIKGLTVSEFTFVNGKDKQVFKDISFRANGNKDTFDVKQDPSKLNVVFDWSKSGSLNGNFTNIKGYTGTVHLDDLEKSENGYKASVSNSEYKLDVKGRLKDKLANVVISKGLISLKNIEFTGNVLVKQKQANVSTLFSLSKFVDASKIPEDILNNFQNITVDANVDFSKSSEVTAKLNFLRDKKKLGSSVVVLRGNNLSITGDVSWIVIKGCKLNTLNVTSSDLKIFNINITGNDPLGGELKVAANITNGKEVSINKFVIDFAGGQISIDKPTDVSKLNLDTAFSFNFSSSKLFESLFNMKGTGAGKLLFKDGKIGVNATVDKLVNKAVQLYNGKVSGDLDDLKIDISSAKIKGQILKGLGILKKKGQIIVRSKLNNRSKLAFEGLLDGQILYVSGYIKHKNDVLKVRECIVDLEKKIYTVALDVNGRNQQGNLAVLVSSDKIDINAHELSLKTLGKVFEISVPECVLNGNIQLQPQNQIFVGGGNIKISNLLSKQSHVTVEFKQNAQTALVQGFLRNKTDKLNVKLSIPMTIRKDLTCLVDDNFNMMTTITGNAHLENIFEFDDGVSLKGEAKLDLQIDGSLRSPRIKGTAEYKKALIAIAGVVLKNGDIKLYGKGDHLIIDHAYFVDAYGKKAIATGDARLILDHAINLDTNLKLNFDNFRLFDIDAQRINITGEGIMTGPLNKMLLSGDLKVPLCRLTFSDEGNEDKYKDIKVINDVFLSKVKKQQEDFFSYDLGLDCSKIEVVGNIYDLEFAGKLHLGNYEKQATLSGELGLKSGKLALFGKRMIFKKRTVKFFENHPFDPEMKLTCSRDIDSMKVFLEIINKPGETMSLNLYSKPNNTPDRILSQMLFGKSIQDLSVGEAAQLAHAVNSLSKQGSIFSILNALQTMGLIDNLSISTGGNESTSLFRNTQSSSGNSLHVQAGKYLSDNVYISVNKKDDTTSFDVDLSIGSKTSLKVNTLGEVGVTWKFRY